MAISINMPRLGLTMTHGVLAKWLKQEGDKVEKGDFIAEIESDKSIVSYESPDSGYLLKILLKEGDKGEIYTPIAVLGERGEQVAHEDLTIGQPTVGSEDKTAQEPAENKTEVMEKGKGSPGIFFSPRARKTATANNVDISRIPLPFGKKRIEEKDVLCFIESSKVKTTPLAAKITEERGYDLTDVCKNPGERIYSKDLAVSGPAATNTDRRLVVTGMRRVIAARMKESVSTAAHVALTTEVDMSNAIDLKNRIQDKVMDNYGVKVSLNDIVLKCTAAALKEYPRINSVFSESEIIEKGEINLGIAVALEEGLIVPVVRRADLLSIGEIAVGSKQLAEKARQGKLLPEEYSGGTFTVSNLGMYDITQFTSIINQPESAILSVAKVVERIVPVKDQFAIKPMMNLTINFDHRPIDGSTAAIFLKKIKTLLEEPYELLV